MRSVLKVAILVWILLLFCDWDGESDSNIIDILMLSSCILFCAYNQAIITSSATCLCMICLCVPLFIWYKFCTQYHRLVQFSPSVLFMDFEMILDIQCSQHITKEGCFILIIIMRWRDGLIIIYYTSLSLLISTLFFQFELCITSVVYLRVTHIHLSYEYEFLFFKVLCVTGLLNVFAYECLS